MSSTLLSPATDRSPADPVTEWDLDVSFIESGDDIDKLIYMTDDNCGSTCQSACTSCR